MTKKIEIPLNKFLFAFNLFNISIKYEYSLGQEISDQTMKVSLRQQINKGYGVKLSYTNPENGYVFDSHILEVEKCEVGKNIDQGLINKYNFNDYENYLCFSRNNNFDIILNQTFNTYINLVISMEVDNQSGLYNKNITFEDNVYYSETSMIQVEMVIADDIITNKNMSNPMKYRKKVLNYGLISFGEFEFNDIILKYVDYTSDKGIILKDLERFNAISYESYKKSTQSINIVDIEKNIIYSDYKFYFNSNYIQSYERTYKKLPEVLADITGIISSLFTIGQIIVSFLCKKYLGIEAFSTAVKDMSELNKNNIKIKKTNENKNFQKYETNNIKKNDRNCIKKDENAKSSILNMNDIDSKNNELINMKNEKTIKTLNYNYFKHKKSKKNKGQINIINNELKKNKSSDEARDKYRFNNNDIKIDEENNNNSSNNYSINNKKLLEILFNMLGIYTDNQNHDKHSNTSLNFNDYFISIFSSEKNNKTKLIDKISIFMENSLSIEEIISRSIYLEKISRIIKLKFEDELNSINFMEIILNSNNELKKILEDEGKKNNNLECNY